MHQTYSYDFIHMTSFSIHRIGHIQYISMHCCMTFHDSFHGAGAPWLHKFVPGQQLPASSPQGESETAPKGCLQLAQLAPKNCWKSLRRCPLNFIIRRQRIIPSLYLEPKKSSYVVSLSPVLPFSSLSPCL